VKTTMAQKSVTAETESVRTTESAAAHFAECAECPSRRGMLRGVAAVGAVGVVGATLAACSGSGSSSGSGSGSSSNSGSGSGASASSSAAGSGSSGSGSSGTGGTALGPTSEVPVGGGKVFTSAQVVVTQPTAGQYKAFTAVCTHAGCTVGTVANGLITCPCHGSQFHIADGSVAQGPASSPLSSVKIAVQNGQITTA
jgi:nitrite reductase/ring-hydroxylating ferredoxin subunit